LEKYYLRSLSMKYEAFWISPNGVIIPNSGTADRHIHMVIQYPEKFGFTKKEIEAIYKKRKEPMGAEGNAREDIMVELMKKGWTRIRYVKHYDSFTIQLYKLTDKIKDFLWDWSVGMISGKFKGEVVDDNGNLKKGNINVDKTSPHTQVKIMDHIPEVLYTGTLGEVKAGKMHQQGEEDFSLKDESKRHKCTFCFLENFMPKSITNAQKYL